MSESTRILSGRILSAGELPDNPKRIPENSTVKLLEKSQQALRTATSDVVKLSRPLDARERIAAENLDASQAQIEDVENLARYVADRIADDPDLFVSAHRGLRAERASVLTDE